VVEFRPDNSLTLEAHDDYWGGRPPLKSIRFVEVPEVASRIAGLLSGQYQFACDIPPDQIGDIEKNAAFEVQGGTILNHRLTGLRQEQRPAANPLVRRAFTHAIDRQAIVDSLWAGRTKVPAGLQWEFYGDMFHADWKVPEYNPKLARDLLKQAGYKGDPITYRVLNNYYTNQNATAQILTEMWRSVGLNVQMQTVENWSQIMERGPAARRARLVELGAVQRPGLLDRQPARPERPAAADRRVDQRRDEPALRGAGDLDRPRAAPHRLPPHAGNLRARGPRLHGAAPERDLHRQAKAIRWKTAPAFAMDFRPGNYA
jgi:peptide/nickel transport system substrate-binding protein